MKASTTALAAALLGAAMANARADAPLALTYLGQQIVASGTPFAGTTVGGLSGIDRVASTGRYVAISDDRSAVNPARFYELSLDIAKFQRSATPGMAGVGFSAVTTIQTAAGGPFAINTVDPESLRFNAASGTYYWSNEGQRSAAGLQAPTVREMRADGSFVRDFAVPSRYLPSGSVAGTAAGDRGVANNLAFESLTLSLDGKTLYTATENALVQDGPVATVSGGSSSRLLSFDVASGAAGAEYVYQVGPVSLAPQPPGGFATNGLTDLLAIGDRQFIAIERSFAAGAATPGTPVTGNTIRLYFVDARHATDVSALDSIAGVAGIEAVQKTLLLDLSDLRNDDGSALALDNIEGLTLGPVVDGTRTLILVSDNNFAASQFTQFVALSIVAVPEPQTCAMWLAGLGSFAWLVRRRRLPCAGTTVERRSGERSRVMRRTFRVVVAAVLLQGLHARAATGWDEAVAGDLSSNGLTPTQVEVAVGANLFSGTVGDAGQGVDRDYFRFTVPANARLTAISVNAGTLVSGSLSFIAIQIGPQVTVTPSGGGASALLGFTHYEAADAGANILPRIVNAVPSLAGELPSGTYSVWIQETGGTVPYSFDFHISTVPEPAAWWLMGAGLLAVGAARKRCRFESR